MTTQHTPGWQREHYAAERGNAPYWAIWADDRRSGGDIVASKIKTEGRARLIAAAPDLLAELQDAVILIRRLLADGDPGARARAKVEWPRREERMCAAIARAK